TETLYVFLVAAGLWLYLDYVVARPSGASSSWRAPAVAGIVLGVATLTRAVLLLFPVGLALHLVLLRGWRSGLKQAILLLAAYSLLISTWTAYNWVRFHEIVIGAQGFSSFLYMGARGWQGPEATDAQLVEDVPDHAEQDPQLNDRGDAFITGATQAITGDPLGYARRRISELANAYLQPHGTVLFSGESLKAMTRRWITEDRSPRGLFDLVAGDWFFAKLILYIFHFTGLLAGLVGMWLLRRCWQVVLPLIGFILYTTLVHLILMVTPRYIFPLEMFWWIFASAALVAGWDAWKTRRQQGAGQSNGTTPEASG
ncbi:MAG: hypothetical protein JW910_16685, partial [Anaerolineae bacterium]|nr:hypothetical protein [Anaerolineae bacterium]